MSPRTTPGSCRNHSGTSQYQKLTRAIQLSEPQLGVLGFGLALAVLGVPLDRRSSSTRNDCQIPRHFDSPRTHPGDWLRDVANSRQNTSRGKSLRKLCLCRFMIGYTELA